MDSDDYASVIYLGAILVFALSYLMVARRESVSKLAKMAGAWLFIFVAVIGGALAWQRYESTVRQPKVLDVGARGAIEIPRAFDGHYYVTITMDGQPVDFVIDTGASEIVLSQEDAARIGLKPENLLYNGRAFTANGQVATARAKVGLMQLGPFTDRTVGVSVNSGAMDGSLLGMTYLDRFDKVSIENGKMILSRN